MTKVINSKFNLYNISRGKSYHSFREHLVAGMLVSEH